MAIRSALNIDGLVELVAKLKKIPGSYPYRITSNGSQGRRSGRQGGQG